MNSAGFLGYSDGKVRRVAEIALLGGAAMRAGYAFLRPPVGGLGEADNVAVAIASGRGIADAYHLGQGATAHLMPVSPGIAGGVYALVGIRSPASWVILSAWSIALSLLSIILLSRVFGRLGVTERTRMLATAYLSLVPVYLGQEAVVFGVWEGALAVVLMAGVLLRLTEEGGRATLAARAKLAATTAITAFVNPLLGLAGFGAAVIGNRRTWSFGQTAGFIALSAVACAGLFGPWAVRNQRLLGAPVITRSNAGLELALATNSEMLGNRPHEDVFYEQLARIHPTANANAYRQVQAIGEVAYSRRLGDDASRWIKAHPVEEARLILFHLRNSFAPEPWLFRIWTQAPGSDVRSVLASLAGVLGLAGIALGLIQRRRGWILIAIMVCGPAALLSPFQPISRYIYIFYTMLVFSAAFAIGEMASIRGRRRTATDASTSST